MCGWTHRTLCADPPVSRAVKGSLGLKGHFPRPDSRRGDNMKDGSCRRETTHKHRTVSRRTERKLTLRPLSLMDLFFYDCWLSEDNNSSTESDWLSLSDWHHTGCSELNSTDAASKISEFDVTIICRNKNKMHQQTSKSELVSVSICRLNMWTQVCSPLCCVPGAGKCTVDGKLRYHKHKHESYWTAAAAARSWRSPSESHTEHKEIYQHLF